MIGIVCARSDGNTVEITVRDNGIGIPSGDEGRIFGMLERLHSQDRYEGSGIGLATCRRIVENHGGRISCRSDGDGGSSFIFTLERGADLLGSEAEPSTPRETTATALPQSAGINSKEL
jgi:signal transduction histidine kinase